MGKWKRTTERQKKTSRRGERVRLVDGWESEEKAVMVEWGVDDERNGNVQSKLINSIERETRIYQRLHSNHL